jgi:amino acid transporter
MIKHFFQELFYVLLGAIVIFSVLELLWPRMVLAYINPNWLLLAWVVSGILLVITNHEFKITNEKNENRNS